MACQATIDHLLLSHCLETRSTGSVTARKEGISHGVTRMATDKRMNHEGHEEHEGDYEKGSLKSAMGSTCWHK
jgi:hypothetical protein